MSNANAVLSEIIEGIDAIDVASPARERFMALVRAVGSAHGLTSFERNSRITFAKDLLRLRVSRPTIRDRLIAMYGVSRPQAYRIISKALTLDHIPTSDETQEQSNNPVDDRGGKYVKRS